MAARLEEFRLAWISLRQLTTDVGCTPLAGLSMLLYILVMTTMSTYQAAVAFYNEHMLLFFASIGVLVLTQSALIRGGMHIEKSWTDYSVLHGITAVLRRTFDQ